MPDVLANGIYPVDYFTLAGVDTILYPDTFWWSSRERYASVDTLGNYLSATNGGASTTEYLDIDLGRVRTLTYINFDVIRAPLDITIEYDIVSSPSRDSLWVPVARTVTQPFDSRIDFDGNNRTIWQNVDFAFTDKLGNPVNTRYLRIGCTRRDVAWPLDTSVPFTWPVFVKHLRAGRAITQPSDAIGPLLIQDIATPIEHDLASISTTETRQIRQRFVFPDGAQRGDIWPKIMGFGVLIRTGSDSTDDTLPIDPVIEWSLYDVAASPVLIAEGTQTGAVVPGAAWLDIFLDSHHWFTEDVSVIPGPDLLTSPALLTGSADRVYELRLSSQTPGVFSTTYSTAPDTLSSRSIPGTLSVAHGSTAVTTSVDTTSVVSIGSYIVNTSFLDQPYLVTNVTNTTITLSVGYLQATAVGQTAVVIQPMYTWDNNAGTYIPDATQNLALRVWADVAESGRDILGNTYRYASHVSAAAAVLDPASSGWMSEPVPSPDAVEALYFDVRTLDADATEQLTVLSAINIAPRTPGVRMNVYYTRQNLSGVAPRSTDEWDSLLWIPVSNQSYVLRRNEIIDFPNSVRAAYIKLEFTALNPLPYNIPQDPPLPPKLYRRYPTWVEDQFSNAQVQKVVQDWFVRHATPVQTKVLQSLADPVLEFQYEQNIFLAALAQGEITDQQTINSGLIDVGSHALIDPVTASKIFLSDSQNFTNGPILSVDTGSTLGKVVLNRRDPQLILDPLEQTFQPPLLSSVPVVSSTNGRISESYQNLARLPMRFSRISRHAYREEEGYFNKKAYFVGIQSIQFLRADYTVARDDVLISDDLYDDAFLNINTWQADQSTSITSPQTVYVSYHVDGLVISDEPIVLTGFVEDSLATIGAPATDVLVFSGPGQTGIQYFQDADYVLSYQIQSGQVVNYIGRSAFSNRLVAPAQSINYADFNTVIMVGRIPSPPIFDSGTVTMVGIASAIEGPVLPAYGDSTYGASGGEYGDLWGGSADSGTVTLVGIASATATRTSTDASTVIMVGRPSAALVPIGYGVGTYGFDTYGS